MENICFKFLAATAYDFQYNIANEERQMVPVNGKEGHITFTAIASGLLGFPLMVKK